MKTFANNVFVRVRLGVNAALGSKGDVLTSHSPWSNPLGRAGDSAWRPYARISMAPQNQGFLKGLFNKDDEM